MTTEMNPSEKTQKNIQIAHHGGGDTVYGIGLFGAWAYYMGRATTTEERVRSFFKAFIWPAILVYELLKFFDKGSEPNS
jgi:hypothetical protein